MSQVKKEDCLTLYVQFELNKQNYSNGNVDEVINYLKSVLSGEVVFWSEKDVNTAIERYIDSKTRVTLIPDEPVEPVTEEEKHEAENKVSKLIEEINDPSVSKEDLVRIIEKFANSKPLFAGDLLDLLKKE